MGNLFVKTESQKAWLHTLGEKETTFKERAILVDELAIVPKESINDLVQLCRLFSLIS